MIDSLAVIEHWCGCGNVLLDDLSVSEFLDGYVPKGNGLAGRLHAIHWTGMRALNEQLNRNVFPAVDQKSDLFAVVGESHSNAGRECFDTLDPRSPVRESLVGCKVL